MNIRREHLCEGCFFNAMSFSVEIALKNQRILFVLSVTKVLLKTTVGELDVELWSKEAPKACRNFVQLCLEGYYDGTVFHRVVQDFIVQGGDPTESGTGGESIYGAPFKDEFHPRLRFVRRGLVAMANAGPHDNGSQFFFTMAAAPELQNKHTMFGKVVGETIFNMVKLQEVEVEPASERPVYPHKIICTHVLSNPFDDIIPRQQLKCIKKDKEDEMKKVKSQSRATKNFKLLSFGDEAEDDEEEVDKATMSFRGKSKSSHDLTNDPQLSSIPAVDRSLVEDGSANVKSSPKKFDIFEYGEDAKGGKGDAQSVTALDKNQHASPSSSSSHQIEGLSLVARQKPHCYRSDTGGGTSSGVENVVGLLSEGMEKGEYCIGKRQAGEQKVTVDEKNAKSDSMAVLNEGNYGCFSGENDDKQASFGNEDNSGVVNTLFQTATGKQIMSDEDSNYWDEDSRKGDMKGNVSFQCRKRIKDSNDIKGSRSNKDSEKSNIKKRCKEVEGGNKQTKQEVCDGGVIKSLEGDKKIESCIGKNTVEEIKEHHDGEFVKRENIVDDRQGDRYRLSEGCGKGRVDSGEDKIKGRPMEESRKGDKGGKDFRTSQLSYTHGKKRNDEQTSKYREISGRMGRSSCNEFTDTTVIKTFGEECGETLHIVEGKESFNVTSSQGKGNSYGGEFGEFLKPNRCNRNSQHEMSKQVNDGNYEDDSKRHQFNAETNITGVDRNRNSENTCKKDSVEHPPIDDKTVSDNVTDHRNMRLEELRKEQKRLQRELRQTRKQSSLEKRTTSTERESASETKSDNQNEDTDDILLQVKRERQKHQACKEKIGGRGANREDNTLALLDIFKRRIEGTRTSADDGVHDEGDAEGNDDDDDWSDASWMQHKLQCHDAMQKVIDANVKDSERYSIVDPRNPISQRRRDASKHTVRKK